MRAAIALADQTGEAISEAVMRERLNWKNQDPLKDHWVAELPDHPGELVGYANILTPIKERCDTLLEVHPAWRRRGLGMALLQNVLQLLAYRYTLTG